MKSKNSHLNLIQFGFIVCSELPSSPLPWNANNVSLVWIEPFLWMLEIADQFNCFSLPSYSRGGFDLWHRVGRWVKRTTEPLYTPCLPPCIVLLLLLALIFNLYCGTWSSSASFELETERERLHRIYLSAVLQELHSGIFMRMPRHKVN